VNERGLAIWIEDENLDRTKMLALHQTAPIGTVIKITNPMTGKSTFAKVVGKFTQNESSKDAIIVLTKATADLIGALDKRFQAILIYGVPNE
jgi:rare lipoprotein A (peptidoglycan hydrolase)